MIALPPSLEGADQEIVAWAAPPVADGAKGEAGTSGVDTALEGADGRLLPAAFVARTVNV